MKQFESRNLTMMMDLYEIMMSNGYHTLKEFNTEVTFDVFYRRNPDNAGFAIFAGLEQVLDYLENLHFSSDDIEYLRSLNFCSDEYLDYLKNFKFNGTVYSVKEGTIMYPNEPIITIKAPIIEAQIIETALLALINHQSLIATKTQRIVQAACGRAVSDFGARRAHNIDAAVYGARAAFIGGAVGTATLLAGQMFNIPVSGTMAHSFIMYHENEYEAFKAFSKIYPDYAIFLVDTYDVLKSGVPNAIKVAHEILEPMGKRLKAIRLDSGDLAYLSKEARRMLDDEGLNDCKIIASNSLDEFTIRSLLQQDAKIDSFGVGERLITAKSDPVFGAVYKISSVYKDNVWQPKIKISENVEKITNPGRKRLWRVYDKKGHAIADLLTLLDEDPNLTPEFEYVDPIKSWKNNKFVGMKFKELQQVVLKNGKRTVPTLSLQEIQSFVKEQLASEIWSEEQRFENPHPHYLDMSPSYYQMKMDVLKDASFK